MESYASLYYCFCFFFKQLYVTKGFFVGSVCQNATYRNWVLSQDLLFSLIQLTLVNILPYFCNVSQEQLLLSSLTFLFLYLKHHTLSELPFTTLVAAAAAKSPRSCPTPCDPIDGSPPGSPVPGIFQARTLEWVAISFSNAWKWKVKVKSFSCVQLLATPWTAAYQAPLFVWFSRQEALSISFVSSASSPHFYSLKFLHPTSSCLHSLPVTSPLSFWAIKVTTMANFTIYELMDPMYLFSTKIYLLSLFPNSFFPLSSLCFIYLFIYLHIHVSIYLISLSIHLCSTGHLHWVPFISQTKSSILSYKPGKFQV